MGFQGYDPNMKAVMNAEIGRLNQPDNEYDPNAPRRRRFVLSPLALLGLALILALVGLSFLLK
ncbi:MAG TPA: hypothetical protein VE338_15220 [Ktedonobacterales bacterium]|jgi:hypothetical protein|nr:hypothetical protein [Ktedonobacterales bacterium]